MKKHLHFICPTDHLETAIADTFEDENYYVTSLGNSIIFNTSKTLEIIALIEEQDIREITFILSDTNSIFIDALKKQDFANTRGLELFYNEMKRQKKYKESIWGIDGLLIPVLSYHLNKKRDELTSQLTKWSVANLKISAKIYNRDTHTFDEVFSDLIYRKHFSLN